MSLLGLVEDGSRAGQGSQSKQATMQDQATSPIMIEDDDDNQSNSDNLENQSNANSGDDTNVQESESQSRRNSSRRRTSPRITREQEKFQALLQELSTTCLLYTSRSENVDYEEEDANGSVSQSLARLYQKATRAGLRVTKANQDEILCWYKYAEGFKNRVREIRSQDSSATDPTARSRVYREVTQHLPGITEANLRKKTQKARNIYKVFVRIGTNKIKRVKSFSADAISSLSSTQIQSIIDRFS
ncbi:hypothetical protein GLOIN_2v1642863 [Rhizophagus irregularis DAOM 181602=DAOM 197198]|uniref:Uncharacterized protein n=1 Tax=Rhizophagus irregularis (strain DAOM 181602 / DAOM 197198 / MUCL 43194) TaxID=747089 RepID=A0A2P4PRD6_RHIID|nr:hypothetical protein GLOIN_2v1642863 [Rhizophagus irregularis DAOM 181602=DAOM 197198]POG67949.1 hypothetical protein GLOIN_2v1642863 [Rhizophagus irregularis DAOM 181602=DAOM 197198]|eukprot:XP_025174815.1 hypothetical protein GLOIN_2v1642863 [Rhizophagus irregularis DAOM 181602=DAOM 197198]